MILKKNKNKKYHLTTNLLIPFVLRLCFEVLRDIKHLPRAHILEICEKLFSLKNISNKME